MKYLILFIFLFLIYDVAAYSNDSMTHNQNNIACDRLSEYDTQSVALHNSTKCCWVIIGNKIFDVTNISERFDCGQDNSEKYFVSYGANISVNDYFIGQLSAKATAIVTLTIEIPPIPEYTEEKAEKYYQGQDIAYMKKVMKWLGSI